jgi:thymidylate synthase (FAD)
MDKLFRIETLAATPNPQQVIYAAMHQDYCEHFTYDDLQWEDGRTTNYFDGSGGERGLEEQAGRRIIRHLLAGNRGHFGPLEAPQITLACGYFPHSVMQQLRTHRVGITFDCQSMRYTGQRITKMVEAINDLSNYIDNPLSDQVKELILQNFYLRPVGDYTNRKGEKYSYTEIDRAKHFGAIYNAAWQYYVDRQKGISEEHARGILPFDYRQHFVMSVNVRSLMHLLDLRAKEDAQLECQWFCDLLMEQFKIWCPEIAEWYLKNRWKKARLAP